MISLWMSIISDKRLMVGGAAMFADSIRNHHIAMVGEMNSRPLLIIKFRE